jgi:alkylation response protein AidB-like acyl-CoA dehydrogenase
MGLAKLEGAGDDPRQNLICVYLPAEAVRIIDNWHVSGLRGTGSCDFTVEDVFVPADHVHGFLEAAPTQSGLLYRLPVASIFPFSVALVPLGIARGAIADFLSIATRTRGGTSVPLREREMIQADVARAEALRRSAKALILEALADLETALDKGGEDLLRARAFFRVSLAHAAENCQRAVHMMAAAAGTAAISETAPLERRVRDVDAAVKHVAMGPHNFVVGGRVLLGLEPGTARF